jgi:SAM-dependent methyltransferase
MRMTKAGSERLRGVASLLAATLLLCGAGIYNGYPLVWPDTGGYLAPVNYGYRSMFYSLLVFPLGLTGSLWPLVFVQSLIVAHLLRLILRVVFAIVSDTALIAITALLCVLTSLPWYTGFIMPDIFTPVLVLCLFVLAFCPRSLSPAELKYILALTVVAATVHYSHFLIAAGLFLMTVMIRIVGRKWRQIPPPNLILPALPVTIALVLLIASNYIAVGEVTFAFNGYAYPLARLVADGQAGSYLRENCPQHPYALCGYIDHLPKDATEFIWSADSPFRKVGWFDGYRREGREIVVGSVMRFPLWTLKSALENTGRQLVSVTTGLGLTSYLNVASPTAGLQTYYPSEFRAYQNSRQSRGEVEPLNRLNRLHMAALIVSLLYGCAAGLLFVKRGQWLSAELLATIACAVLGNSFASGALSGPSDRYGSRLIWLLPFFALASSRQFFDSLRRGGVAFRSSQARAETPAPSSAIAGRPRVFRRLRALADYRSRLRVGPAARAESIWSASNQEGKLLSIADVKAGFRRLEELEYPELAGLTRAQIYDGKMGPGGLYLAARMARTLTLKPGMTILDLGCGRGATSVFLARQFGVNVLAVDWWISANELNSRTHQAGLNIVPLHLDITQALPFAESCFDAIFCMDAIHYFGANPGFIPHLLRHLKPGGRLCIGSPCFNEEFDAAQLSNLPHEYDDGTRLWNEEFSKYHSPHWWADRFRETGLVTVLSVEELPDGVVMWEDEVLWNLERGPKSPEESLVDARQIAYGYNHRPYLTHFVLTVEARPASARE